MSASSYKVEEAYTNYCAGVGATHQKQISPESMENISSNPSPNPACSGGYGDPSKSTTFPSQRQPIITKPTPKYHTLISSLAG